jgi:hypothetical protein
MNNRTSKSWGVDFLLGFILGALLIIAFLMAACEPVPDDDGHHRESPSNYKRY